MSFAIPITSNLFFIKEEKMEPKTENTCPTCGGKKILEGVCECSQEWRGTQNDDVWDDCQCTPDQECTTCQGTGVVEVG
jgi:hypothetical protein